MVASSPARAACRAGGACLNPLHCGAVVASRGGRGDPGRVARHVSIPFIAGQWSLQAEFDAEALIARLSQSPSLRGSGRFHTLAAQARARAEVSQSPSLRGSGRFMRSPHGGRGPKHGVSIPFIAGQWSLLFAAAVLAAGAALASQSPSLRGSGRFNHHDDAAAVAAVSQSPSLRGSGRFALGIP